MDQIEPMEEPEPPKLLEDAPVFAATLSTSPLRGRTDDGEPVLIVGFTAEGDQIVVFPDGRMQRISIGLVRSDWRYDEARNVWVDVNDAAAEAETPEEDGQPG